MIASSPRRFRAASCVSSGFAVGLTILLLTARADARRIGFANVARDGQAARAAIESSRATIVKKAGGEEISAAGARAALEEPVEAAAGLDAGALARARGWLEQARAALKTFDYDESLDALRQADAALRGLVPAPEVTAELYEVNLLVGQVLAARGDEALALTAFALARRLVPEKTALDPARYRPQVVQLYGKAGGPAAGGGDAGAGVINVVTEPPGAIVWLDGRSVGAAPMELGGVAPGEHYLGASLDGHVPRSEHIVVRAGGRDERAFLLARLPAEQRARALRVGLLRPELRADDWRRGAAALADVASVDVLVLVRDAQGGGVEAAAWDARAAQLGKWVTLADDGRKLAAALPAEDAGAIAVPRPRDVAGALPVDPRAGDGDKGGGKRVEPAWYRTWWGVSLLIGGGIVVTGAILALTSQDNTSTPDSLVVTDPHWDDALLWVPGR